MFSPSSFALLPFGSWQTWANRPPPYLSERPKHALPSFLPSFLPSPFLPASDLVSFLSPLANPTLPKLPFGALRAANGREGGPYSSRLGKGAGWQFNRIFIGLSFGPRIGLSFGSSVKLKRSYVQTARIGPAFTQWGMFLLLGFGS